MVGPGRLELPTPRLSSVCSNQLSYGPIPDDLKGLVFQRKRNIVGASRHTVVLQAEPGVFRFDGHLTGAIYVLKSTGRFILIKLGVLPIPQLP